MKLRIEYDEEQGNQKGVVISLDGKKVDGVKSISFSTDVIDSLPRIEIEKYKIYDHFVHQRLRDGSWVDVRIEFGSDGRPKSYILRSLPELKRLMEEEGKLKR